MCPARRVYLLNGPGFRRKSDRERPAPSGNHRTPQNAQEYSRVSESDQTHQIQQDATSFPEMRGGLRPAVFEGQVFSAKMPAHRRHLMTPVKLTAEAEPTVSAVQMAKTVIAATDGQVVGMGFRDEEAEADFELSADALNCHRVFWRLREEWGSVPAEFEAKLLANICFGRAYAEDELSAALIATRDRPRLPFGWNAMDLAKRRLERQPVRLLNPELELSRYAKGIVGLAVHLQGIQGDEAILLPVDLVREALQAKKVVVAGTITKLVESGLLEMTKATYNTGSAREFKFLGIEGKDYVFERAAK